MLTSVIALQLEKLIVAPGRGKCWKLLDEMIVEIWFWKYEMMSTNSSRYLGLNSKPLCYETQIVLIFCYHTVCKHNLTYLRHYYACSLEMDK
jgi:hypothetical protein